MSPEDCGGSDGGGEYTLPDPDGGQIYNNYASLDPNGAIYTVPTASDNKSSQTTFTAVIMAFITISTWIMIVLSICYFSTRPLHKTFLYKSSSRKNVNAIEMSQI